MRPLRVLCRGPVRRAAASLLVLPPAPQPGLGFGFRRGTSGVETCTVMSIVRPGGSLW